MGRNERSEGLTYVVYQGFQDGFSAVAEFDNFEDAESLRKALEYGDSPTVPSVWISERGKQSRLLRTYRSLEHGDRREELEVLRADLYNLQRSAEQVAGRISSFLSKEKG